MMEFRYDPDRTTPISYDVELTPVYCDPNTGELIPMPNGFPSTDEEAEMTLPRPSGRLDHYYALRTQGAPIREALMEAWMLGWGKKNERGKSDLVRKTEPYCSFFPGSYLNVLILFRCAASHFELLSRLVDKAATAPRGHEVQTLH